MGNTAYVEEVHDFLQAGMIAVEQIGSAIDAGDTLTIRSCSENIRARARNLGLSDVANYAGKVGRGANKCCMAYTLSSYLHLRGSLEGVKKEMAAS